MPTSKTRRTSRRTSRRTTSTTPARQAVVVDTSVVDELRDSFLAYALSVIVARALPDARDGLKPVHRRILFSLHSQNITPSGPYKKSARVVGDTMARYHPHGDSAIYEALVRLAQEFSMRVPLVDPHGNFGSLDDSPAASRYTECRLAPAGLSLLAELDENTVDFVENYDGTEREPSVLPAAFPNLLVNGSTGVAVGMATNIPPHNLAEVVAAAKYLLANDDATIADLCKRMPAPDFPTGGELLDRSAMRELYKTGRGNVVVRATTAIITLPNGRKAIEVTELPYMVGPEKVIARIRELISDKKLPGLADARDYTDRNTGLRLVFEVRPGFDPKALLAELYRLTPMQDSFAASFVALIDGRPKVCSLLDLLRAFVDHRRIVVRRRSEFRLDRAARRAHLVEGLLVALADIDDVVATIRSSRDTEAARTKLVKRFSFSVEQVNHVLEMPLRRLTTLEVSKLKDELAVLKATMKDLKKLLASKTLLDAQVAAELDETTASHQTPRRTKLTSSHLDLPDTTTPAPGEDAPFTLPDTACTVALTVDGSVGLVGAPLGRAKPTVHDLFRTTVSTSTHATVYAVTAAGTGLALQVAELTELPRGTRGRTAAAHSGHDPSDPVVAVVSGATLVVLHTASGLVKRLTPDQMRPSTSWITLAPGDRVISACSTSDTDDLFCITTTAQLLRYPSSAVRPQQRAASGMTAIHLDVGDTVIAAFSLPRESGETPVLVATDTGAVKVSPAAEFPVKGRATGGVRACRLTHGSTKLIAAGAGQVLPVAAPAQPLVVPAAVKRDASATALDAPCAFFASLRP